MKIKRYEIFLLGLACCAVLFTAGFFTGRLTGRPAIYISGSGSTVTTQRMPLPEEPEPGLPPVNLNTADEETLCSLPGIGPDLARSIIAYREEHGSFTVASELMNISGIGQATYEKLKSRVTLSESPVSEPESKGETP